MPSVVRRGALGHISAQRPRELRHVAITAVLGVACCVAAVAPFGLIWLVLGIALVLWAVLSLRALAPWSVPRPSLVFSLRTSWDGVTRTAWEIYAVDPLAEAVALVEVLSGSLGEPAVVLIGADGSRSEVELAEAIRPQPDSAMIAFAVRGAPEMDADTDADGVWVRLDGEDRSTVTLLANEGAATTALVEAAKSLR